MQVIFSSSDYYIENHKYYSLKYYRTNQIFSRTYFRNLIAYYFYDKKHHKEILNFLQKEQPHFYWLADQLWNQNINRISYNPATKIWYLYIRDNKKYNYQKWLENCNYFGKTFCGWLEDISFIYESYYKKNQFHLKQKDYYIILKKLEIYLTKSYFIPFMYQTGKWLPKYLREIGLPLESAIILKNMQYRQSLENKSQIRQDLIFSLVLSGDPDSAYRLFLHSSENILQYQNAYYHIFNILMMSKNYKKILEILKDESNFQYWNLKGSLDMWTSFPITKHLLEIRIADLLFWKTRNSRKSLILLERFITNKSQKLTDREKQYARLIQSRILYNENLKLSRKIAEDVQFKAQEKSLYLLEYYATLWYGWNLYKSKQYYPANIEFTKAYNIAKRHFPDVSKYSALMGLLLTKRKFGITDISIIKKIQNIYFKYIPDAYFFTVMEWLPEDIHYDIWKDIYIEYLLKKKKIKKLLVFILKEYQKFPFFSNAKNPGAYPGLYTTYLWKKYFRIHSNFERVIKPDSISEKEIQNFLRKMNYNHYIFFLETTKYRYGILLKNKNIKAYKIQKNKQLLFSFRSLIQNEIQDDVDKKTIFVFNPHASISHIEVEKIIEGIQSVEFALFYRKLIPEPVKKISNINNEKISDICTNRTIKTTLRMPEKISHLKGYPYLLKFFCDSNRFIRLWDMERFYPENLKLIFYRNSQFTKEEYQTLYFIAVSKNWILEEILSPQKTILLVPISF